MAQNIRTQVLPGVDNFSDGTGVPGNTAQNTNTLGRSTLFGQVYMALGNNASTPKLVGGMQAFSVDEINETQFRSMLGSDWQEPVFGRRYWQGQGSRFQVRSADLRELLARLYSRAGDVDFRMMPFVWKYAFLYQSADGQTTIENLNWQWMTCFITNYSVSMGDPFSLIMENFSFLGKGYSANDAGSYNLSNAPVLWGAGGFTGAGQASGAGGQIAQTGEGAGVQTPNLGNPLAAVGGGIKAVGGSF